MGKLALTGNSRIRKRYADLSAAAAPSLPSGLVHQWKATVGVTNSGTTATGWADQVGSTNLVNTTGTPLTGTRTLNGLNVIDFNGSSSMGKTTGVNFWADAGSDGSMTWGLVCVQDTTPGSPFISNIMNNQQTFGSEGGMRITNNKLEAVMTSVMANASSVSNGTWRVILWTFAASNARVLYENGSSVATSSGNAPINNAADFELGMHPQGIRFLDGAIAEVWVWDHQLDVSEVAAVGSYTSSVWGV